MIYYVNYREDGKLGRFIFDKKEEAEENARRLEEKYPKHNYSVGCFDIADLILERKTQ